MKTFFAKNWPFILIPMLIVAIAIAVIHGLADNDPSEGFQYGM
ncbi:MAG: hypothetical protein R3F49_18290 [Planctomycetota bacterium]